MATATWSVRVEFDLRDAVSDDDVDELTDRLSAFGAAVALEEGGHLCVQLTVEAGTFRSAFDKGERAATEAARQLLVGDPVEVQVLTQAEFERRLEQPQMPEIWGVTEAITYLGVSAPRLDQLVKQYPEKLPYKKLAGKQGARLFLASTVRRFEASRRREAGRPSKKPVLPADTTPA